MFLSLTGIRCLPIPDAGVTISLLVLVRKMVRSNKRSMHCVHNIDFIGWCFYSPSSLHFCQDSESGLLYTPKVRSRTKTIALDKRQYLDAQKRGPGKQIEIYARQKKPSCTGMRNAKTRASMFFIDTPGPLVTNVCQHAVSVKS